MLKGRPGSAEFMDHYAELLAQSENAAAQIGASKIKPGSIDALIVKYLQSDIHQGTGQGDTGSAATNPRQLPPVHDAGRSPLWREPACHHAAQEHHRRTRRQDADHAEGLDEGTRHLIAFAIEQGECKTDPTIGIKTARPPKSSGHLTWGDVQIAQYREQHANGTMARLAMELMLNIAARRHDAHLIGRQHLRNGCLSWRPSKTSQSTGKVLTIRVLPELQAALDAMPHSDALTFLLTEYGRPFASAAAFGNKFADWCEAAGLEPVVCDDGKTRNYRAHGLRKAACKQLAHAGCTAPEIMAVSGHASLAEVQKYINAVEQDRLAEAAMVKRAAGSKRAQTGD